MSTERVTFRNREGLELVGTFHTPQEESTRAVIISHGFSSNKDRPRHAKLADALVAEGIAALRFDYGGHGESGDRHISAEAQISDLEAAVAFIKARGYTDLGLQGESLGGLVSLKLKEPAVKTLSLWAPVTSNETEVYVSQEERAAAAAHGFFTREKPDRIIYVARSYINERETVDQDALLREVTVPVFIIHGTEDHIVPLRESEKAINKLPKGSLLEPIEGWGHGDEIMESGMEVIIPKTVAWLKAHV